MRYRIGLLQMDVTTGDVAANLDKVEKLAEEAGSLGAQLVVAPEICTTGYAFERFGELGEPLTGPSASRLSELARRLHVWLGAGLVERDETTGHLSNTYVLFDPDGRLARAYRKLHRWWYRERDFFTAGTDLGLVDTDLGRLGVMICYDGRFPEVARALTLEGAELVIWPQHWPWPPHARPQHLEIIGRARAIENSVFVATVNRVGRDEGDGLAYCGRSFVADPLGDFVAAGNEREGVFVGTVDTDMVAEVRGRVAAFTERRPDLYRPVVDRVEPATGRTTGSGGSPS